MKLVAGLLFSTCFLFGAAAFDNSGAAHTSAAGTSLTTGSFTITSNANRVCVVHLYDGNGTMGTINSVTCGGVSASLVSGASETAGAPHMFTYCAIAPASGSQTASASWTNSVTFTAVSALTFSSADQTTGCNNGNAIRQTGATTISLAITSNNGDMTTTGEGNDFATTADSSNQTNVVTASFDNADHGPGTGTTTHIWTVASNHNNSVVGVNVIAAGGAAPTSPGTKSKKLMQLNASTMPRYCAGVTTPDCNGFTDGTMVSVACLYSDGSCGALSIPVGPFGSSSLIAAGAVSMGQHTCLVGANLGSTAATMGSLGSIDPASITFSCTP